MYRADLIRAAKAAQNKTLEDLAAVTGLNVNTVAAICNGKDNPELKSLHAVCDALGLSMANVFSNVHNQPVRRAA